MFPTSKELLPQSAKLLKVPERLFRALRIPPT